MIIVKIYLRLSLELLWTVWGQFIFRQFLGLACTSQGLFAPSYVVGANYRISIYCTCHFQSGSLCYVSFICLLVSSVSHFCPDTRGAVVVTFFRLPCSVVLWGGRNTASKCLRGVIVVSQPHWVCPRSRCVCFPSLHCSGSSLLCRELSEAGPGLHLFPRPLR